MSNQSTIIQEGSPSFQIKLTKTANKVVATAPTLGLSAEGSTNQTAISALRVKASQAIQTGTLKQV